MTAPEMAEELGDSAAGALIVFDAVVMKHDGVPIAAPIVTIHERIAYSHARAAAHYANSYVSDSATVYDDETRED